MGISMKTTSGKILASVALVGTAAAVAGMGTYGAFTSSTSASQTVKAGTIEIGIGADNNTLTTAIAGMLPGDSITKYVTLANSGDSNLGSVTLTTAATATSASLLTTDTTNGLKITVDSCSVAWTGTLGDTCTGTKGTPLTSSAIIGVRDLGTSLASLTAKQSDFLKITTTLPKTADDTFQGKTSTIGFTFAATQRAETAK
jgi:predicted ribosomally synthesized peptide with SipW-like signal peptide